MGAHTGVDGCQAFFAVVLHSSCAREGCHERSGVSRLWIFSSFKVPPTSCRESLQQCSTLWMRLRIAWRGLEVVRWFPACLRTSTTSRWGHPSWEDSLQAMRHACSLTVCFAAVNCQSKYGNMRGPLASQDVSAKFQSFGACLTGTGCECHGRVMIVIVTKHTVRQDALNEEQS